ncbi:CynX/NimT family MFS transporter [Paenibacillus sp. NPDC058071]|uniref:CynX/NimT family MFS transporter n=1 Tax=Paenibacillus sp. NPDC058071 TaxID=3346326 RepID=UPI0036DB7744
MKSYNQSIAAGQTNKTAASWLLILGIAFVAANLRAPITSVGPLIGDIKQFVGLSNSAAGMLTTVPLLAFALLSPVAPKIARRFGMERTIFFSLLLLTAGIVCRSFSGTAALFGGTVLLGMGIAVCNVLLPSLVKRDYSNKVGLVTGIYSVSMNLCGALASGLSVPLARYAGLGWSGALNAWLLLAVIGILFWLPALKSDRLQAAVSGTGETEIKLSRSPLAWQVTIYMGMQSSIFYIFVAWFPEILISRGMSSDKAGWMLFLFQFAMLPFTFLVPIIAGRMKDQRPLVVLTTVLYLAGIGGLFFADNRLVPLWSALVGIGGACSFGLALIFFTARTRNAHEAARLSGMAQSLGYLLAAVGPLLFGLLHDATQHWTVPLMAMLVIALLIFAFGMGAARNRQIGNEK